MKIALIAPYSLLESTAHSDYHLLLPQCLENKGYEDYALLMCRRAGTHVILDNGADDDGLVHAAELQKLGSQIGVDEVVIPDILDNPGATLKQVVEWDKLSWSYEMVKGIAVVQGTDPTQLQNLIDAYAVVDSIETIAFPRRWGLTMSPATRLEMADWTLNKYGNRFKIHFLGAQAGFPEEVLEAARMPNVRGLDTSLPFSCGYHMVDIAHSKGVSRPEGYFEIPREEFHPTITNENIMALELWAQTETRMFL